MPAATGLPARGTDRTITAICDHGTPSTRWARRSASAIIAASACAEAASRTVTDPSSAPVPSICLPSLRARQPARDAADGTRHRGRAPMRLRQRHRRRFAVQQPGRLAAAEAEHRLVGVPGDQRQFAARGQHPDQAGRLRVELLGVVDQQHPEPGAFGGQ